MSRRELPPTICGRGAVDVPNIMSSKYERLNEVQLCTSGAYLEPRATNSAWSSKKLLPDESAMRACSRLPTESRSIWTRGFVRLDCAATNVTHPWLYR